VWHAFEALVVVGIVLGSLYGTGLVSSAGLLIAMLCVLLAFVPWAVFQLDPRGVTQLRAYRDDAQK
jgi:hypothetical protein